MAAYLDDWIDAHAMEIKSRTLRLGHADPANTLRVYAHVIRCAKAAAADIFAQAMKAAATSSSNVRAEVAF